MSEEQEEQFEEISSDEVDRIVSELETLIESTDSENIRSYLEEAMNEIYYLVYEDEEGEGEWDSSVEACDESDEDLSDAA